MVGRRRGGPREGDGLSRLLLVAALAASLVVPVGGAALITFTESEGFATEWDKDEMVDIHNELVALDEAAGPSSAGHAVEARRIAREARAWAARYDAELVWREFALATAGMADVLAGVLEDPSSVTAAEWDAAAARLEAAQAALPPDRQPE